MNGIGTGLLPAFFTFEAKGKEGDTDLGMHFGFAPQVSAGRNVASSFGTDAAGAQIDMRQVYLTVGGSWGQILAGKELGLFERQAILTDMTLFGAGVNIGFRGTALGRIGYGYLYTDFRAQFTYSTPAGKTVRTLRRSVRADHDGRVGVRLHLRRHPAFRGRDHLQAEARQGHEHAAPLG